MCWVSARGVAFVIDSRIARSTIGLRRPGVVGGTIAWALVVNPGDVVIILFGRPAGFNEDIFGSRATERGPPARELEYGSVEAVHHSIPSKGGGRLTGYGRD